MSLSEIKWASVSHDVLSYIVDGELNIVSLPTGAEPQKTITDDILAGTYGPIAEYTPPSPVVPVQITMRQCRLQLLADGLLDDVDAAIAAMPSPQKEAAEIEWEYSAVVQRTSPLIAGLAPALGLDDSDVDQLFISAALL